MLGTSCCSQSWEPSLLLGPTKLWAGKAGDTMSGGQLRHGGVKGQMTKFMPEPQLGLRAFGFQGFLLSLLGSLTHSPLTAH